MEILDWYQGLKGRREKVTEKELPVNEVISFTFSCITLRYLYYIAVQLLLYQAVCGSNFSGRVDYEE